MEQHSLSNEESVCSICQCPTLCPQKSVGTEKISLSNVAGYRCLRGAECSS